MKISAYVPDELWARVEARFAGARPSPVTQLALRRLVERSRPRFAGEPQPAPPHLRARVAELRQRDYDEGYEAGLALCESLGWSGLERLAAGDWEAGDGSGGSHARRAGTRDALSDVWLAVVQRTSIPPGGGEQGGGDIQEKLPS